MGENHKPNVLTRRGFLGAATAAVAAPVVAARGTDNLSASTQDAASAGRIAGANSLIRIGIIGCGNRPNLTLLPSLHKHLGAVKHAVVALADPWRPAREKTAEKVKELYGVKPQLFDNYRQLLVMKDIDAVMIASPDHHHTTHLEAAAKAKKHVYCEKPMGIDIAATVRASDAAKQAGTVIQIGTQHRSSPGIVGARNVYQSGILGTISRIEEIRNAEKPYWYKHLGDEDQVKQADLDWKEFLGSVPFQPFDPRKYAAWYGYYEFSQGPVPQWGSHFIDLVHFVTSCGFPDSCVCLGGTFTWRDENHFTAPDQVQALWTYPEGFMVSYMTNFGNGSGGGRKMLGDKGLLNLANWDYPVFTAEGGGRRDGSIRGVNEVERVEDTPDHWLNWLQCMANGDVNVAAPPEAGLQHAVATIMAMTSLETGLRTHWDSQQRTIVSGPVKQLA